MFEDAEEHIQRILKLVEQCPEPFKGKCFEVLLEAYAEASARPPAPPPAPQPPLRNESKLGADALAGLPADVVSRFRATARRLGATDSQLENLFDFTKDPFVLHAYQIPGSNKADQTRNVALLVAAKAYLYSGSWTADWKEIKAECVNQNCYDMSNHAQILKKGEQTLFKTIEANKNVELTSPGTKAAEALLKKMATGSADASEQ